MHTRQGTIFVGLTVTLIGLSGILGYGPLAASVTTSVDWSTLHGVDYAYLYYPAYGASPPPSISFPLMTVRNINFIRVPFSWLQLDQNPSAYLAKIDEVASAADANGLKVLWAFVVPFFPLWVTGGQFYPLPSTFWTSWWNNQITISGQNGWQLMMQNFWAPVIAHVDSHPSTLGYELVGEPPLYGAPITAMQTHNQFFATQIRALSSKTIVFMGAGSDGFFYDPANIPAVAPTVSNIGVDIHSYDDYANEPYRVSSWVASAKSISNVAGQGVVGEYGPTSYDKAWASQVDAQTYLTTHLTAFKNLGVGHAAWLWGYGYTPPRYGYLVLLDASGNPWWYTDMIASTISTLYGITTTSSTTTTSTSTSTTSTSSISSTTSTTTTTSTSTTTTTTTSASTSTTTGCTKNCNPVPFPLLASITTIAGAGVTIIGFKRKEDG